MPYRYAVIRRNKRGPVKKAEAAVAPETYERAAELASGTEDFDSLKKDELVALADERGVDSSGTKAEIIARLEGTHG